MTSQKLLDDARKQAQEITNWFHTKASPDNDPRAIEHLAIRLAEFAASCLENSVAIQAAEKAILIQEIEQHTATKALLKAREKEIERLKGENERLCANWKIKAMQCLDDIDANVKLREQLKAKLGFAERELAELRGKK